MTSEERVLTLFAEANPIRDPEGLEFDDTDATAHLESLEARSIVMTRTIERASERKLTTGRWAAVAVVAVTVGAIAVLMATRPAEPVPITTLDQRIDVIESLVSVHNSGDFEAFKGHFTESPDVFGGAIGSDADWEFQRSFMAANEQWEFSGPCEEGSLRGEVVCPMTLKNDFMEPAGLFFEVAGLGFTVAENGDVGMIGSGSWDIAGVPEAYFAAFDDWLAEAHPEVHDVLGPRVEDLGGGWGRLPKAEDMDVVLRYVDEFLAQSADYPLEP